ncbi:MAG: homogentisate 1,2-dioxygenase [Solimicrobium sp.]|nr:homogentisate 1,2-dioxygenase [Solimicrobium sp.]
MPLKYQTGFGNEFATEAIEGALPIGQNSPQRVAYGLYAEQISGTAFTAPRSHNRRSWTYRIRPSAMHDEFKQMNHERMVNDFMQIPATPNQLRWDPLPMPVEKTDFIDGLTTMAGTGSPDTQIGCAIYLYAANGDMSRYFYSADGEFLIVPQQGCLLIKTEFGFLEVAPQEIALIPRGIRFQVMLPEGSARGYVCENFGSAFRLPDLGVIGSNGLANPRDFEIPVAQYENKEGDFELVAKFSGHLWSAKIGHSPLDVVAWHGNYAPCKYDLRRFNTIGSISYDHPDPSLFLVFQSQSDTPGVDAIDFVIFPPRWLAAENTFRPPWFHRNIAAEFMGLIHGVYDAKAEGFLPGGSSLHNCMAGHGPDAQTFAKASQIDTSCPQKVTDSLAFMFETRTILRPTLFAMKSPLRQVNYADCWQSLAKNFTSER